MKKTRPTLLRVIPFSFLLWGLVLFPGCTPISPEEGATPAFSPTRLIPPLSAQTPEPTPTQLPTRTQTQLPTQTYTQLPTPTPTSTPNSYAPYTHAFLTSRAYGGGNLEITQTYAENSFSTRYLFRYPSDGLDIYGFMDVPVGEGPFSVVIALHGYIDPAIYQTLDYTTGYADDLARAGFFVLHPNLRGYPPSDEGENLFRVGMAIDVLNLIALVREGGGQPGLLAQADPGAIGLWGHSMGGGIATRVLTVSPDVRAAVLYAPMSGDERQNWEAILGWSGGSRGIEELTVPEGELETISPVYFFDQITAAVSIHHGREDELVPLAWSVRTCEQLVALRKNVECLYYPGQPHTFHNAGDREFMNNVIAFFRRYLQVPQDSILRYSTWAVIRNSPSPTLGNDRILPTQTHDERGEDSMKFPKLTTVPGIILAVVVLVGCSSGQAPTPTPMPTHTATSTLTFTPRPPTATLTSTSTRRPSSTPFPTWTTVPSLTPVPKTRTPIPTPGVVGVGFPDDPLFDDFSDPGSGWAESSDSSFGYGYLEGAYRIYNNIPFAEVGASRSRGFADSLIDVDVTKVSGPDDAYFGVTCRETQLNYYSLTISGNGEYAIRKDLNNKPTVLVSGTSPAIKKGNVTNHLTASCEGSLLKLKVNGVAVVEWLDSQLQQSLFVGLIVGTKGNTGIVVKFDNFKAREP